MNKKRTRRLYTKLIILILSIIIIMRLFTLVLSKYESITNSTAYIDVAFYLLKEDYKTMTTNLNAIYPKEGVYVYNFTIGNEDGTDRAEIDLIYNLKIRTTTNLPLDYELYMNEQYTDTNATNIIKINNIEKDENGTYFRTITTDQVYLDYKVGTTNTYQLVIRFPIQYNQESYQDIIELLEITVDAKQVISQN